MIHRLLDRLERRITFVVGKGGVGKTTTAGGVALALADLGDPVRLLSTDPAHSLADLFGVDPGITGASPCTDRLLLEELDGGAYARTRFEALEPALRELIERGTYLDVEDAESLLAGTVPGLDEIGAALRIEALAREGGRLVVDTAPTGHTLRLLDAPAVLEGWVRVFEAMAEKADAVASALVGEAVRFPGERALAELVRDAHGFTDAVRGADFVVVTGPGGVVRAETDRLGRSLAERGCCVAATVAVERPGAEADVLLPFRPGLSGCAALRAWIAGERPASGPSVAPRRDARDARPDILEVLDRDLIVFAGKGGVGKTTSAAAAALVLARRGPVLLTGADPAGSLHDVLPDPPPGVEVRELDAERELERFQTSYREEVERAFAAVGLESGARLDRHVVESLWGLAPPGLDEIVAVARLAEEEASEGDGAGEADGAGVRRRVVLDTAPTGHFLRLVGMPALTRDWLHRLMRILLKYRALGGLDAPAGPLLRFARRMRALQERLSDPSRTAIILVTLDEPIVRAETRRLRNALRGLGLAPAAILLNRRVAPEPVGAERLRVVPDAWERIE
ncbi:MAG TPA: ArsA-related P-loop ATPase [Longimicrobiales bacterium]|nr:ArsA-related P-loop ATPase [Longimicrobiales bacterium]